MANLYNELNYENTPDNLSFNPEMRNYLLEAAKWARFLSILGFIFIGLMVIGAFTFGTIMTTMMGNFPSDDPSDSAALATGGMGVAMTIYFLLFALLYFFPTLYLYQFASKTKLALQKEQKMDLAFAFSRLKSFFKFWGILLIIIMGFYALGIAAVMFGMMVGR